MSPVQPVPNDRRLPGKTRLLRRPIAILLSMICLTLLISTQAWAKNEKRCMALAELKLKGASITDVAVVPPGLVDLADGRDQLHSLKHAACRIQITHIPAPGSLIKTELWLPIKEWNKRFLGLGNGGEAGGFHWSTIVSRTNEGFATAQTDMGTRPSGNPFSFAIGNRDKAIDFGYRATQVMTLDAQQITEEFYGKDPKYRYFQGCSTGGQQALSQAIRYPQNYDGIVAISPVTNRTTLHTSGIWNAYATHDTEQSYIDEEALGFIHREVLQQCDSIDGLRDGLIDDPRRCRFDFEALRCDGQKTRCLNEAQIIALSKLYDGPRNPRTNESLHAGFSVGVEPAPRAFQYALASPPGMPRAERVAPGLLHWAEGWDDRTFDFDNDMKIVNDSLAELLNADNPDLSRLKDAGTKLLMIGGWADQVVPPLEMVNYYDRVVSTMGGIEQTQQFARLFMAPGMYHCAGGYGASEFDRLQPMIDWVEEDQPPSRIIARQLTAQGEEPVIPHTRPLCLYPAVARWKGYGSQEDAKQFRCTTL